MTEFEWFSIPCFSRNHLVDIDRGSYSLCEIAPFGTQWEEEDDKKPYCKTCERRKERLRREDEQGRD